MRSSESIKQKAIELGFDIVGITTAEAIDQEHIEYLRNWLDSGCAAKMKYMHRNFEKRVNPGELLEGAESVICVGLNYKPAASTESISSEGFGRVANFALYEDYHVFIKKMLNELVGFISSGDDSFRFKVCVDSAPLAERSLAERAGLGFIGKSHMLIHPELGSQILLGEIITDMLLEYDEPMQNHCPDCYRCVRACPTGAINFDGNFDANKCISYLTIEHDGPIEDVYAGEISPRLFGCDECILACPYELNAPVCKNGNFKLCDKMRQLKIAEIVDWETETFEEYFARSSLHRSGLDRLKRNTRICLKQSG